MQILLLAMRYWKPLAVIGLCVGLYSAGWWRGHSSAAAACHEKELRAEIAALHRDQAVQRQADQIETELNKAAAEDSAARESELMAYVDELRTQKDCRRSLDDADLKRLRKIDSGDRR